ncbi:hypothetical protein ACFFLM_21995 [Deinococcus oregonensis]|uniref:Uncharacterized protein n=1 Tax=Deinococcus oregonensis TaxID=1805970 RepID=A0ABV6B4F5_9DEIO
MIYAFLNPADTLTAAPTSDGFPADAFVTDEFDRRMSGLSSLLHGATLIPVTSLDEEELLNVPAAFFSWQVLRHGAVVINPDGEEDPAWRRLTAETLTQRADALNLAFQAAQHIEQLGQLGTEAELIERAGRPLLVRLTHPHDLDYALDAAALTWETWLEEGPFRGDLRLMREGDLLTMLPKEINPESAVNYVLAQLEGGVELTLGVSASQNDAAFLSLCDFAMIPGGGPLLRLSAATETELDLE